ncbi:hypothetical protein [Lacinutrix jangbogonensis]|uniref:hypothetical protein n=1 Tax=Lacinutrix jangbogonensis TaxID=1469557 RepID=UPI00053DD03D|nr:hypothetical protein [Lacinutrix jangbogonensis]
MKKILALVVMVAVSFIGFAQEDEESTRSNVQEFTPSKLLNKGQWDIKFFNSLYTQTKQTGEGTGKSFDIDRQNFFTNTTEIYTGVSENSRINVGLVFQIRSNTLGGQSVSDVFSFKDNGNDLRSGLTTIAPSIRIQPFKNISNFSLTSTFYIPVFADKADTVNDNVFSYLDLRSYAWETKFFYDKTFGKNKWQVFTEVDFKYNFGDDEADADENSSERFANNSLTLPISAFLSYFPSSKSTIFVNAQQAFLLDLGNDFAQNSTTLGFGGKYQITNTLNLEASYGKIVRGNNFQGLGNTFSIGVRALF